MGLADRLIHAWNAFTGRNELSSKDIGYGSYIRPSQVKLSRGNERTMVSSVINRIAVDVAQIDIEHARLDDRERFTETIDSGLHNCLTMSANIDQTGRSLIQDGVMTMLDSGVAVFVPVDTSTSPMQSNSIDILTMRIGKPVEWFPEHIKVNVYNDKTGHREDIILPKKMVAIVENPFYSIMNEPNSTLQRLIHKLNMLDAVDEQASSGKLDLIIQLPYVVKTEARKVQAESRRKEIEEQLAGSKYGIAYTDGTEKITQLNRSLENNLLSQIQYLTSMFFNQLGMPETVFNGTADEQTMLNYNNRTLEPIVSAITEEMRRKFLTKTARSQGQSIVFFKDPFKLVPVAQMAEIADKFTRNEILSSNEVRQLIGYKPVNDPKADELRNKNLNESEGNEPASVSEIPLEGLEGGVQNES